MKISSDGLLGAAITLLVPVATGLVFMYSDVQQLKETKADKLEVTEMKAELGKQMALNTQAIQNLDTTLGKLTEYIHRLSLEEAKNGQRKQE